MRSAVAWLLLSLLAGGCGQESDEVPDLGPRPDRPRAGAARDSQAVAINPRLLRRFKALRAPAEGEDQALVDLGQKLYFDPRLSHDGDLSCNSCHRLDAYGVDGQATSSGHRGQRGRRNSPTVFNAAGQIAQFWDGRAVDVEQQAMVPILDPTEMAMVSPAAVTAILQSIPGYVEAFARVFPGSPEPIDQTNITRAIGAFERRLVTRSRWDRFLDGDRAALSAAEIEGLKLFADVGCVQCHTGENLGGSMFQRVGVAEAWPNQGDQGRFDVTRQAADRMQFKVPGLRNVARTGPYFHDGSARTLEEAVEMMARYQIGAPLSADEIASIVAWLGSLTGELPARYARPPELPPDGPRTAELVSH